MNRSAKKTDKMSTSALSLLYISVRIPTILFNHLYMLLGAHTQLEDHLLVIFAKKGALTVHEITQHLKKRERTATIQGIYRVLRKLQRNGVVIKEKQRFSLRIPWVLDLAELVTDMENTYLTDRYLGQLLPNDKQPKRSWRFTQLAKLNDFWSQILLAMAKMSQTKISLDYSPHTWYELLQMSQEHQFIKTYYGNLKREYVIVGSTSFLDKYTYRTWGEDIMAHNRTYFAAPEYRIIKDPSKYVSVMDDYVLVVKLDKDTVKRIEDLYTSVIAQEQVDIPLLTDALSKPVNARIVIQKHPQKAKQIYRKFEKIFGPLDK